MFTPVPGATVGGKYRLERPLAQGGMGAIWVAWQTGLDRRVAIKFMARELSSSPIARARFDREAKAAAQLRTPHVVHVHDHGIEGDTPYIAMELLEGEDLNARLRRVKRLSLPDAARLAFQVAKALRRAQEAGLVHRDLKPANIFLAHDDGDEIVKILDFGVARLAEQSGNPDGAEPTRSGAVVGSPHYMSPEQARGVHAVDHRSDLWALGVILFRAVTGALPFPGTELGDIILRVWNDPAPVPSEIAPDLPRALDAFFARALAKSPADRFQTAPELSAAFAEAAGLAAPSITSPFDPRGSLPSMPLVGSPSSPGLTSPTPLSSPGVSAATPLSSPGVPAATWLSSPGVLSATPLSSPGVVSGSSPSSPGVPSATPLSSPAATSPTPVSWPGALATSPSHAGPLDVASRRVPESPGGTLGGSHEVGPRPASQLPKMAWIGLLFALIGIGAGVVALVAPSSSSASGSSASGSSPIALTPLGNAPVASPSVGSTGVGGVPVGSTGVGSGSTGVGSTGVGSTGVGSAGVGSGSTGVGSTGVGDAPAGSTSGGAAASEPASASGTARASGAPAASAAPASSAKSTRGGGRPGHDFGY